MIHTQVSILSDAVRFLSNPLNLSLTAVSLAGAIVAAVFLIKKTKLSANKKIFLAYTHIFLLIFPLIFFVFSMGCNAFFTSCSRLHAIFYIAILAGISAFFAGIFIAPFVILKFYSKNSMLVTEKRISGFVDEHSARFGIKHPSVYLLNSPKPKAFSFRALKGRIFISAGMANLLTKKELEAVLLHEMSHLSNKASIFRQIISVAKLVSPLTYFVTLRKELGNEELAADRFVCKVQKTKRYLNSAKGKVNEYNYVLRRLDHQLRRK